MYAFDSNQPCNDTVLTVHEQDNHRYAAVRVANPSLALSLVRQPYKQLAIIGNYKSAPSEHTRQINMRQQMMQA